MGSWAKGIETITLFVEDLDAATSFYEEVFGLPKAFEDADSTTFKFGDMLVNLLKITEANELVTPASVAGREAGSRFVLTLAVDDVDATCEELISRGATLLNGPMNRPWGVRTASFMDPAGYIWEIAN